MRPTELIIQLADLESKTLQLMAAYAQLKKEHQELSQENESLRESLRQKTEESKILRKKSDKMENNFQNSQKITKLVKSIQADTQDTAGLKEKLDEYIQEITKCISYLSQ
jgi:regulator of replication initiation timing